MEFPYIVGGDFNILRHVGEKTKKTKLTHFVINTWSNNQKTRTL